VLEDWHGDGGVCVSSTDLIVIVESGRPVDLDDGAMSLEWLLGISRYEIDSGKTQASRLSSAPRAIYELRG
jgi:hypothetical protein